MQNYNHQYASIKILIIHMYFYNIKLFKSITRIYISCCLRPQNYHKKFYFFSLSYIKMSEKTINFGDKKINKKDFYNNKNQFN